MSCLGLLLGLCNNRSCPFSHLSVSESLPDYPLIEWKFSYCTFAPVTRSYIRQVSDSANFWLPGVTTSNLPPNSFSTVTVVVLVVLPLRQPPIFNSVSYSTVLDILNCAPESSMLAQARGSCTCHPLTELQASPPLIIKTTIGARECCFAARSPVDRCHTFQKSCSASQIKTGLLV
jgi:hypothetical protein